MKITKISVLSAIAVAMLGTASFAVDDGPTCLSDECEPAGGNPGNGKPVGNSPWDGITGNSARNDNFAGSPRAATMNPQRDDSNGDWIQPGNKGTDSSNANK